MKDDTGQTGFRILPIDTVRESSVNPRTTFDPAALEELRASIADRGVLVPLLVRPVDDHFELVDGARRLRAARLAGLADVPSIVQDLAMSEAAECAIVANLQRQDVSALDEARGFTSLLSIAGGSHSASTIARQVGKSERYVWDRLRLLELVPLAQQLLDEGRITLDHAVPLSRLTPEQQTRAIDPQRGGLFIPQGGLSYDDVSDAEDLADDSIDDADGIEDDDWDAPADAPPRTERPRENFDHYKAVSVRELKSYIAKHVRFDAAQAAAAAPLDFGALAERVDSALAQPGRGKKVIHITHDTYVAPSAKSDERTYCGTSWKRADGSRPDAPTCDHSVLGLIVVGPEYGSAFDVCVHKDCDVHWAAEKKVRARAGKQTDSALAKQRQEDEAKRKAEQQKEDEARDNWKAATPRILAAVGAAVKAAKLSALVDFVLSYEWKIANGRKAAEAVLGPAKTADDAVRTIALLDLRDLASSSYSGPREFPKYARAFGIDLKALLAGDQPEAVQTSPKKAPARKAAPKPASKKKASKKR